MGDGVIGRVSEDDPTYAPTNHYYCYSLITNLISEAKIVDTRTEIMAT